jgi:hypothetical protein
MTLKSEIKMGTAHELGCRIEDTLEATKKLVHQYAGAATALQQAAKAIEALTSHIDKDVDAQTYDLETAAHIKKYIGRAAQIAQNLAIQSDNLRQLNSGKTEGLDLAIQLTKKLYEEERRKPEPVALVSIKEQRLAETNGSNS